MVEGDYVLREGAPLGSDAKFYLVESGTVRCLKTYQVQECERCLDHAALSVPVSLMALEW